LPLNQPVSIEQLVSIEKVRWKLGIGAALEIREIGDTL
jgi:hypothetical protein